MDARARQGIQPLLIYFLSVFGLVFGLWLATPFFVPWLYPGMHERAHFGDLYGFVNSLFSGFALIGVVAAIFLQWDQAKRDREEAEGSAKAQDANWKALEKTIHAQSFKTAIDLVNSEDRERARDVILYELDKSRPLDKWPQEH